MNVKDIAYKIASSLAPCVSCGDLIDCWPAADESEPAAKVFYSARDAVFAGCCSNGHINEFYLSEAKAEEYLAHDITERTLGRFVPQDECKHERHIFLQIQSGQTVPSATGPIVGPETVKFCGLCGMRKVHVGKEGKEGGR